ncbi:MAG: hypothetical protein KGD64_15045 [Candidatus Heimdallarchaeota archaeon]|nr:hypothetical protein [Candidatus Heimdallarchaeota archaeon]
MRYLRIVCIILITSYSSYPLIHFTLANSSSLWGEYQDEYEYDYLRKSTIFDIFDPERESRLETLEDTYFFYNLTTKGADLFFRTSECLSPLEFIECVDEECFNYTIYKQFDYDPHTETIKLGFRYNETTDYYYILDGEEKIFANIYEYTIPFDMIKLFWSNYFWNGIFGIFLPTSAETFAFKIDYSEYTEFTTINCDLSKSYWKNGRSFNGYQIEIQFTGGVYFGYLTVYENHDLTYCYTPNGILHTFTDLGKLYSNNSGENILIKETLISIDLVTFEGSYTTIFTIIGVLCAFVLTAIIVKKRRLR